MILAFDTYYFNNCAKTVAVQFEDWNADTPSQIYEETLTDIADYESGQFYKRELPCILSLLKRIDLSICEVIIIDGFVVLDDNESKGLGCYLFEELETKVPIIGIAKNNFLQLNVKKRAVYRGESKKALFVTAKGIDLDVAARYVKEMHGEFRIPTLLKTVDSLGRL